MLPGGRFRRGAACRGPRRPRGVPGDGRTVPPPGPATAFSSSTLAELYFQQGLVEHAVEVYRQLLDEAPGNERARARLAEIQSALPPATLGRRDGPRWSGRSRGSRPCWSPCRGDDRGRLRRRAEGGGEPGARDRGRHDHRDGRDPDREADDPARPEHGGGSRRVHHAPAGQSGRPPPTRGSAPWKSSRSRPSGWRLCSWPSPRSTSSSPPSPRAPSWAGRASPCGWPDSRCAGSSSSQPAELGRGRS